MTIQNDSTTITLYAGRRVIVVGLGRSGMAAAHALRDGGATVLCWDDGEAARTTAASDRFDIVNPTDSGALDGVACMILAPGIPLTHPRPHPAVKAAHDAGVEIIGDIELLFRARPAARYVGITGTNGKSTTTALIGHILTSAGIKAAIGGNIGIPALSLPDADVYVLEMSSYQLDLTPSPAFDFAVLLNITPDHLDRHGGMPGYVDAKRRILRPRTADSLAVIGTDSDITAEIAADLRGRNPAGIAEIGRTSQPVADLIANGRCPAIAGDHGIQNAAAAFAVAKRLGLTDADILRGLETFPGLAHRQERVATLDGITFINDSKATNAEAAARALSAFDGIYWIAGGRDKNDGYAPLDSYLPRVRQAFLIGEAADAIDLWIAGRIPTTRSGDLSAAIHAARAAARNDDNPGPVLLSPACASFDQFPNFEIRGETFKNIVLALPATTRIVHGAKEAA